MVMNCVFLGTVRNSIKNLNAFVQPPVNSINTHMHMHTIKMHIIVSGLSV